MGVSPKSSSISRSDGTHEINEIHLRASHFRKKPTGNTGSMERSHFHIFYDCFPKMGVFIVMGVPNFMVGLQGKV